MSKAFRYGCRCSFPHTPPSAMSLSTRTAWLFATPLILLVVSAESSQAQFGRKFRRGPVGALNGPPARGAIPRNSRSHDFRTPDYAVDSRSGGYRERERYYHDLNRMHGYRTREQRYAEDFRDRYSSGDPFYYPPLPIGPTHRQPVWGGDLSGTGMTGRRVPSRGVTPPPRPHNEYHGHHVDREIVIESARPNDDSIQRLPTPRGEADAR